MRDKLIQAGGHRVWQMLSTRAAELSDEQWNELRHTLAGEAFRELTQAEAFAQEKATLAQGDARSFLSRNAAREAQPRLTEWRLFMDTVGSALAARQKLLLDSADTGRRHLLLGVPASALPASWPVAQPGP